MSTITRIFFLLLVSFSSFLQHMAVASTGDTSPLEEEQAQLIPWSWYVKPDNPNYTCPSVASTLGTFAIINVLVSLSNVVIGNRLVCAALTRGWLGKPNGRTWLYMFIFPVAIQLGANAAIATLYKHTAGYGAGFTIADLTLFYTTRPRMGWLVLACLMPVGRNAKKERRSYRQAEEVELHNRQAAGSDEDASEVIQSTEPHVNNSANRKRLESQIEELGYYEATAKGAALAEIVLLLISTYYTGWTAHFAATHGYYKLGTLDGPFAHDARIMYSGALLNLISLALAIFYLALIGLGQVSDETASLAVGATIIITVTSWLGSWLFWAGYVRLAADLYCPPKLLESGVIWTTLSSLGTAFFGGGGF